MTLREELEAARHVLRFADGTEIAVQAVPVDTALDVFRRYIETHRTELSTLLAETWRGKGWRGMYPEAREHDERRMGHALDALVAALFADGEVADSAEAVSSTQEET